MFWGNKFHKLICRVKMSLLLSFPNLPPITYNLVQGRQEAPPASCIPDAFVEHTRQHNSCILLPPGIQRKATSESWRLHTLIKPPRSNAAAFPCKERAPILAAFFGTFFQLVTGTSSQSATGPAATLWKAFQICLGRSLSHCDKPQEVWPRLTPK